MSTPTINNKQREIPNRKIPNPKYMHTPTINYKLQTINKEKFQTEKSQIQIHAHTNYKQQTINKQKFQIEKSQIPNTCTHQQ